MGMKDISVYAMHWKSHKATAGLNVSKGPYLKLGRTEPRWEIQAQILETSALLLPCSATGTRRLHAVGFQHRRSPVLETLGTLYLDMTRITHTLAKPHRPAPAGQWKEQWVASNLSLFPPRMTLHLLSCCCLCEWYEISSLLCPVWGKGKSSRKSSYRAL